MKRLVLTAFAIAALAGAQHPMAQGAAQAEKLLAAADHAATIDGDLKGAIEQYKRAFAAAGAKRALAAEALLHMAQAYQKLGDTQSKRIYEQLLRDYADQKDAAAMARASLAMTSQTGMTSRRIAAVAVGGVGYGSVSPDGRYFPYTNWQDCDLYLRDLLTGEDRRVTDTNAPSCGQFPVQSTFSRDSKQLAYGWANGKQFEIRVVNLEGAKSSQPRRVFANDDVAQIFPDDWSPDGKWIAVQLKRVDKTAQIGLLGVQDGSLRVLKSVDWRGATRLMFSPDGKYLAYDLADDQSGHRSILVLSIDGSREIAAAAHPSNNVVMGWSPDGRSLLFDSDRSGTMGLWTQRLQDGKIVGTPEPIKTEIAGAPLGVTKAGGLYFLVHHPSFNSSISSDIRVATIDFDSGNALSPPAAPIQSFVGANNHPRWSRDGKYLAYLSTRPVVPGSHDYTFVIAIRSMDTGQMRELHPELRISPPAVSWSGDGLTLFAPGTDLKGRRGIFRIDARTGETSPIAISHGGGFGSPQSSPDGKKVYYLGPSLIERDLVTGTEKTLTSQPCDGVLSISRDGQSIVMTKTDTSAKSAVVLLVSTTDGSVRELSRVPSAQRITAEAWTADGKGIVVGTASSADSPRQLWKVRLDGGQSQKLDLAVHFQTSFSIHPDGRQIAYAVAEPARPDEVWVLENFLPEQGTHK